MTSILLRPFHGLSSDVQPRGSVPIRTTSTRRSMRWSSSRSSSLARAVLRASTSSSLSTSSPAASAELARTMSAEDADVDLGGFPFLPRSSADDSTDVSVDVSGANGVRRSRVSVRRRARMATVKFSAWRDLRARALELRDRGRRSRLDAVRDRSSSASRTSRTSSAGRSRRSAIVEVKGTGIEVRSSWPERVDLGGRRTAEEDELTKPARYLPRVDGPEARPDSRSSVAQVPSQLPGPTPAGSSSSSTFRAFRPRLRPDVSLATA